MLFDIVNIRLWAEKGTTMKVEVEFMYDLDPDGSCQMLISEDELPTLTKDDMRALRITSTALSEVFAEARELTSDLKPNQRIIADRIARARSALRRSKQGRFPCRSVWLLTVE